MPKQRKAHITPVKLLKLATVFIGIYLLIATGFWMAQRISYHRYISSNLHDFTQTEEKNLRNSVFTQAFQKARVCLSVPDNEKISCQQEVRTLIASHLYEEVLNETNSIHFIKREGNTLYTLNWAGELSVSHVGDTYSQLRGYYAYDGYDKKYATQYIHLPPADRSIATYINLFSDRCKYFDLYDYYSCQVVSTIHLSGNSDGYVVSMMVLTEEEMWFIYAAIIPLTLVMTLSYPQGLLDPYTLLYVGKGVIIIFTPALIAWLYWKKYLRDSS